MALKTKEFRITSVCFFFCASSIISCQSQDRIIVLAEYLKEEKRLRDSESSEEALQDSLKLLKEKYGIDRDAEIRKLGENPGEWIDLLRELKRGR
ncbi:MAG: hypothetical protein OEV79_09975 [candidate division WOR-3 bacterium]|nr:hypothetical protein [candidate division WOR-3 bacterium]